MEMAAAALPAGSVALVVTLEIKADRIEVRNAFVCPPLLLLRVCWGCMGPGSQAD